MNNHVLVWDLETVPDLPCVARVHGLDEDDHAACREALGEKFPKLPFHKVVCIGALIAERRDGAAPRLALQMLHEDCNEPSLEREAVLCVIPEANEARPGCDEHLFLADGGVQECQP